MASLDATYKEGAAHFDGIERLDATRVQALVPVLRDGYAAGGVFEAGAMDMDVNALHQGFLRGARAGGAELRQDAPVEVLQRQGGAWKITAGGEQITAKVVINAAGAWCDALADMAGAGRVGLVPKRRTAILFDGPADMEFAHWPAFVDVDEQFYARPESGALFGSPADETPVEPCDAQPEELDIAIAADRLQTATMQICAIYCSDWSCH